MTTNIDPTEHTHRWLSGIASRNSFNFIVAQRDEQTQGFAIVYREEASIESYSDFNQFLDKWSPELLPWYIMPNTSPILLTPLRDPVILGTYDVFENMQGDKYSLIPYKDENINIGIQIPDYLPQLDLYHGNIHLYSVFSMMLHARPQFLEKAYIISVISDNVIYHAGVKDGKLQTGFAHHFTSPEDVLYFTMLSYKEMKADPKDVPLHLINEPQDDGIMSLLKKYVKKIQSHESILGSERWKSGYLSKHFLQQFQLSCVL